MISTLTTTEHIPAGHCKGQAAPHLYQQPYTSLPLQNKVRLRSVPTGEGITMSRKRRRDEQSSKTEAFMERKIDFYEGAADVAFRLFWTTKHQKVCAVCSREFEGNSSFNRACKGLSSQLKCIRASQKAATAACPKKRRKLKQAGVKQGCIIYLRKLKKICLTKRACSACERTLCSASSLGPMLSNIDRLSYRLASRY